MNPTIDNFYITDSLITKLSIALRVTDSFTGEMVLNSIRVSIPENNKIAYKNPSGYFIFTDIKEDNYLVAIDSEIFFPVNKQIDISSLDPKNPVVTINLIPNPAYPFPENATLIRGIVTGIAGPIENASIKVISKQIETMTDERGEFALYFKDIKNEHIQINIQKGGDTKVISADVLERRTVSIGVIPFP